MQINGIDYWEDNQQPRSPKYRLTAREFKLTRSYQRRDPEGQPITEADRMDDFARFLGFPQVLKDGGTTYLSRSTPHAYPGVVSFPNPQARAHAYATEIAAEPYTRSVGADPDDGTALYEGYRYEVTYEALDYFIRPDDEMIASDPENLAGFPDEGEGVQYGWKKLSRYVSRRIRNASRVLSIRNGLPKFIADGPTPVQPIKEGFGFNQYRAIREYTWRGVPVEAIPENAIIALANNVNYDAFDGAYHGTLLFVSADIETYPSTVPLSAFPGQPDVSGLLADVKYTFCHMPNADPVSAEQRGWNSLPRVVAQEFRYWRFTADGNAIDLGYGHDQNALFKYGRFAALFRPDQV